MDEQNSRNGQNGRANGDSGRGGETRGILLDNLPDVGQDATSNDSVLATSQPSPSGLIVTPVPRPQPQAPSGGAVVRAGSGGSVGAAGQQIVPGLVMQAGERAALSYVNFFSAHIANANTRSTYMRAWREFSAWAENEAGVALTALQPFHVATYRETLTRRYHPRSVKLHLSALRCLFDRMVIDQVIPFNPASSVKSPRFSAQTGVTPVLSEEETRQLFQSLDTSHLIGLRDRAVLAVLVYTVGRITAVVGMRVGDFYQDKRKWKVRLHEKGGKLHEVWAHHNLADWMGEYIEAAGIEATSKDEKDAPLFRSTTGETRRLNARGMSRQDVGYMIKRRCRDAGLSDVFSPHSFRATGITLYMSNGGSLNEAQKLAGHADPRTTKLYDRSSDTVSLDEIERIRF